MKKLLYIFLFFNFVLFPQPIHKIMNYNALNYPGSTAAVRNPYFSIVISNVNPDLLVMQENTSQAGLNGILNNVLIPINPYPSSPSILSTLAAYTLTFAATELIDPEIKKIISEKNFTKFEIIN